MELEDGTLAKTLEKERCISPLQRTLYPPPHNNYFTNDTKSITYSVTSYSRHGNNFLLVHRPNIKANVVKNKLICDSCTMPTSYPIIGEFVVKQTKSSRLKKMLGDNICLLFQVSLE